jgi:hypothetical protein
MYLLELFEANHPFLLAQVEPRDLFLFHCLCYGYTAPYRRFLISLIRAERPYLSNFVIAQSPIPAIGFEEVREILHEI